MNQGSQLKKESGVSVSNEQGVSAEQEARDLSLKRTRGLS